jgi:hypothetical protein
MALESKPLFHPEVLRQQVRAFSLPERVGVGIGPFAIHVRKSQSGLGLRCDGSQRLLS